MADTGVKIVIEGDASGAVQAAGQAEGALNKVTGATQGVGEAAEKTELKTRELHEIMRKLDGIVPGAGQALKLAFHPDEVGVIGLVVAFEALKTLLENIKAIDEIKMADFVGDKDTVDAVRESWEKIEVSARMFTEDLIRANSAGSSADAIAKRQIETYKNLATAQADYNTAQKNLGDAQIDASERNGLITHQQALQQKFALDVDYAQKKLALEAATDAQELNAKKQQLTTQQQQLAAAQGDLSGDEANAGAAAAAKVKHERDKKTAQDNVENAQKTLDELGKSHGTFVKGEVNDETVMQLKEYFEKYTRGDSSKVNLSDQFLQLQQKSLTTPDSGLLTLLDHTIGSQTGPEELAKYQGAKEQQDAAKKQLQALEDSQYQVDLNAERGKKQLDATEDSIRSLTKSVSELAAQIPQMAADSTAKQANAAGVQNLDLRAKAINKGLPDPGNVFNARPAPVAAPAPSGPPRSVSAAPTVPYEQTPRGIATGDFVQFEAGFQTLSAGGKLDSNQMALMEHIAKLISGHEVKSNQILGFMRTIVGTQTSKDAAFAAEVATLTRQMQSIQFNHQ